MILQLILFFIVFFASLIDLDGIQTETVLIKSKCANGYYKNVTTGNCNVCRNGTYSTADNPLTCGSCPANNACVNGVQIPCDVDNGYFSPAGSTQCQKCPSGYIRTQTIINGNYKCTACEEGQWSFNGKTCAPCLAGFACIGSGHYVTCVAGSYSTPGSYQCTPCGQGYYNTQPGSTSCLTCKPGEYSFYPFQECYPCPDGFACMTGGDIIKCLPGSYSGFGSSSCLPCSGGSYSDVAGASSCQTCGINQYSLPGASNCTQCLLGQSSPTGSSQCNGDAINSTPHSSNSSNDTNLGTAVGVAVAVAVIILIVGFLSYRYFMTKRKELKFNHWTGGDELLEEKI